MSNSLSPEVRAVLGPVPAGLTLLITVGNAWRFDDGVGPYLAKRLAAVEGGYRLLDAGDRPEDILEEATAAAPAKVIILDAADFGGQPGEVRVITPDRIPNSSLTTHSIPLSVLVGLLARDTRAPILLIGIQPKSVALGEGLSEPVRLAAEALAACIESSSER